MNTKLSINLRDTPLLNEKEAAEYLNIAVKTLQYWRVAGGGPAFIKMGRLVRYELSTLSAYIESNRRLNTCNHY